MSFLDDYKQCKDIDATRTMCFEKIIGDFLERDTESALIHLRGGYDTMQAHCFLMKAASELENFLEKLKFKEPEKLNKDFKVYLYLCFENCQFPNKALHEILRLKLFKNTNRNIFKLLTNIFCGSLATYGASSLEMKREILSEVQRLWMELELVNLKQSNVAKKPRYDALSRLILEIAKDKPNITANQLLDELYKYKSHGVIDEIDDVGCEDIRESMGKIYFLHSNKSREAPISGLPDRLNEVKRKIAITS